MDQYFSSRKEAEGQSLYGILSAWAAVISGIPLGSVLGPILSVMFINYLPDMINSTVHIFADDTKVYRRVASDDDRTKLQDDIKQSGPMVGYLAIKA